MNTHKYFESLIESHGAGKPQGIPSVCSAHPLVIQAAMEEALLHDVPVLIEATANQVNQDGGYTGMAPADFRDFVYAVAESCGFPHGRIMLGGDHLGPHPWRRLSAEKAMQKASELVKSYVLAGFSKIHLDTSMHLGDDELGAALKDEMIAQRSVQLCGAAEREAESFGENRPVYVVGSEVPPPGGPAAGEEEIHPTSRSAFLSAYGAYERAFEQAGLQDAFSRIVAFVVQPGVEFTGDRVFEYSREAAGDLCSALKMVERPIVFEGHSTDYQTSHALSQLVEDGIGILKVGPGLTFALREGLVALEAIEAELLCGSEKAKNGFSDALEQAMLQEDKDWRAYYRGDDRSLYLQRRYSYYDRARYYLGKPPVKASIEALLNNLEQTDLPEQMLSQYLPLAYRKLRAGEIKAEPREILLAHIRAVLANYHAAAKAEKSFFTG